MSNRLCYVCEGGDCTEMGSGDLFDKLRDLVKEFDPDEERIKEQRAMMNKVLFETKGTLGKPDWAIKRDEKRKREAEQKAAAAAAAQQ